MISLKHGIVHLRLGNKKVTFQQKKEEMIERREWKAEERKEEERRGESDGASLVDLQLE